MRPFVFWVKHHPASCPVSHIAHIHSHSTPPPALWQLAEWCHLELSAVTVAYHWLDRQLLGTVPTLSSISL